MSKLEARAREAAMSIRGGFTTPGSEAYESTVAAIVEVARWFAERALSMANAGNERDGDMHLPDEMIASAIAAAERDE